MSKSVEEMIENYVDKFMSSPKNKKIVYEALLNEKSKRADDMYMRHFEDNTEDECLVDYDDLADYDKVIYNFDRVCEYAEDLSFIYYNWDIDEKNEKLLYGLLYVYIKLDECIDGLEFLESFPDDDIWFGECEELDKINDTIEAVKIVLEKIDVTKSNKNIIEFKNVVVKTNIFKCNKNHNIEQIQAIVKIVDFYGDITEKTVPVGYCKDCDCYFILEKDYHKLKRYGVILCRIISEKVYYSNRNNDFDLQAESILHQAGYNVSASEGLSTEQRREILKMVVDSGLYSVSGLCGFLDYLIDKNERVTTRDMSSAIYKWQTDRDFIAGYEQDSWRQINVGSLKEKIYEELPF